jgi:hypothetical protein
MGKASNGRRSRYLFLLMARPLPMANTVGEPINATR